jgi:hypothetical protein
MSQDTERIKATARRTLEEIFPEGDAVALAQVVHPDVVNHEAPAGAPQGLAAMTRTMLWLKAALSERRYEIHRVIVPRRRLERLRCRQAGSAVVGARTGRRALERWWPCGVIRVPPVVMSAPGSS